jgi:hypothetical protein
VPPVPRRVKSTIGPPESRVRDSSPCRVPKPGTTRSSPLTNSDRNPTETLPYSAAATKGQYGGFRVGAHDPWHALALAVGGAATSHKPGISNEVARVSGSGALLPGIDPSKRSPLPSARVHSTAVALREECTLALATPPVSGRYG